MNFRVPNLQSASGNQARGNFELILFWTSIGGHPFDSLTQDGHGIVVEVKRDVGIEEDLKVEDDVNMEEARY